MEKVSVDKVAIYIRWSTEDQGEGTTLDVQLEGCRHYVLSQGWRVRDDLIFIDDGYSGASLERPALTRLRGLVKVGEVECVVVYKLDRLSRSVADTARLCMDEWEGVCHVKSAREPIDTTSQAGKMFFYTLMNYAEWERAVIRDRTHSGRVRRAQEGRDPGITIPYGYTKDPDTGLFQIVPHEAAIVRKLFEGYRLGSGLIRLVNSLNGEGIPFRDGRKWQVQTIGYMLRNRAYTGDLVWGHRIANPRYGKREGERQRAYRDQPLVVREGVYPPIISREEFDLVQSIRNDRPCRKRGSGGRSMASEYLLTGLLKCGLCGASMVGRHNDPSSPRGYYYFCMTRSEKGRHTCHARSIQCRLIDTRVVSKLLRLYDSDEARQNTLRILQGDSSQQVDGAKAQLAEAERQLERLQDRERKIGREYSAERITLEEFRLLRQALQEEGAALRAARERAETKLRALDATAQSQSALQAQLDQLGLWETLSVPERKNLLRQFVERVTASKDDRGIECEIVWKVPLAGPEESEEGTAAD